MIKGNYWQEFISSDLDELEDYLNKRDKSAYDLKIDKDLININYMSGLITGISESGQPVENDIHKNALEYLFRKLEIPTGFFISLMEDKEYQIVSDVFRYGIDRIDNDYFLARFISNRERGTAFIRAILTDYYSIYDDLHLLNRLKELDFFSQHQLKEYKSEGILSYFDFYNIENEDFGIRIVNSECGESGLKVMPLLMAEAGSMVFFNGKKPEHMIRHAYRTKADYDGWLNLSLSESFKKEDFIRKRYDKNAKNFKFHKVFSDYRVSKQDQESMLKLYSKTNDELIAVLEYASTQEIKKKMRLESLTGNILSNKAGD